MDALIGQRLQDFETVTGIDCVELYSGLPPFFELPGELSQRNTRQARSPRPAHLPIGQR